ncbi:IucA/IucC family protein [Pararhizobium sp.]|uniref:IucA/IucC family protein n=1 Tax=Pararhizobium sp. TaxID=1977563 RepID=UPI002725ADB0|nr:IucA/IucC family protein [Pararhizobium sp.]MDO9417888.1 IucA/IucC family protein [Pararhizobium sp.]
MMQTSRQRAEQATFQSFANCYLREVNPGMPARHRLATGSSIDCIEWSLPRQHMVMRAEILSHSLCGPHHFGRVWGKGMTDPNWRQIELLSALHSLIHESYRHIHKDSTQAEQFRGFELELLMRVLDSYQHTTLYLDRAAENAAPPEPDHFLEAEQSLIYGHWLHPTPKSRQGMTFWQQESYAPELGGQFRLHYFAARADHVRHRSARSEQTPGLIRAMLGTDLAKKGELLLPMHPLQAEALLLDPDIQALQSSGALRHLGPAGPLFTATSSVRTVYCADEDWMLKFSLPVRITNSVRLNRRQELDAGVAMAKLIDRIGFARRSPDFHIIQDPAYITLDLPGRSESGFETILRENPFRDGRGRGVITVAALTAEPRPGERSRLDRIIRGLAARSGDLLCAISLVWFQRYLDCACGPLVRLFDDFGIALEAHQQNSLIDIGNGYPAASYYRDNQGFYLSERYRSLLAGHVPETETIASLYFAESEIRDRFAYYLIVNQIFSVISRMGHDGLCDEAALLHLLRAHLERCALTMTGAGRDFARHVLDQPAIASKGNLTTRLFDIDELQANAATAPNLYRAMPNPLRTPAALAMPGTDHAIAS